MSALRFAVEAEFVNGKSRAVWPTQEMAERWVNKMLTRPGLVRLRGKYGNTLFARFDCEPAVRGEADGLGPDEEAR